MTRPTDWSPLELHSDPIPGDPQIVAAFGGKYSDVADAIKYAAAKLNAIANHDDNGEVSQYVDKLRDTAKDVANDIQKAHERYAGVAEAMQNYASPLERAQTMADAALTKARGASDQVMHTTALHNHYEQQLNDPGISSDDQTRYTHLQQQNSQALSEAQGTLNSAQQDLQAAITLRNQAAKTASDAVHDVESSGGLNDSWWTKMWEKIGPWVDKILTIASWVASVLAIIALFIPGIGEIVALIGLIVAIAIVINAACQMSAGTKSWQQGVFEIAMAVIPLGAGRILGRLGSAAEPAIEDAASVTLRTSKAAQGVEGFTKTTSAAKVAENLAESKAGLADKIVMGPKAALRLAKMNDLAEMSLTKGGASPRIAGMVDDSLGAYRVSQIIEPTFNASTDEYKTDEAIGEASEPQEMVTNGGR